jgi:hypothetical protein
MEQETISNMPCPLCLVETQKVSYLRNRPGANFTYCEGEKHKHEDTEALKNLIAVTKKAHPDKFPKPAPATAPLNPAFFLVDPDNKKALEQLLGMPLSGASELKSAIWNYQSEIASLKEEVNKARSLGIADGIKQSHGSPVQGVDTGNRILFTCEDWVMDACKSHAEHEGKSVQEYLQEQFDAYLQVYFSPDQSMAALQRS